ncbi:MAG: hypothetical protein LBT90_01345 [Holosporaceae bacterium]|jgi:hypothetical protein|nr:hypothetical protein [Holosporaceae bacterium]
MYKVKLFALAFCMTVCSVDALGCHYSISSNLAQCRNSVDEILKNTSTECCPSLKDLLNTIGTCLTETPHLSRAASIIDYCGIGGCVYLAGRCLLKDKCEALRKNYQLQSLWQKALSSD